MKFYVLVSGNIWSFEQCIMLLPKDRTQVVINTLDESMVPRIINCCNWYGVKFIRTKSDGTPATGKNSLIKTFLDSNDEYAVCVDGDDIITPWGIKFYTELAKDDEAPDIISLYKQVALRRFKVEQMHENMFESDMPMEWERSHPLTKCENDICFMTHSEIKEWLAGQKVPEEKLELWTNERYKFQQFMNAYSEDYEYMSRMVWFSRKAAEYVHYENDLVIGEDTVQFMKLKKLAFEGKLRMYRKRDGIGVKPTYIMNQVQTGITQHDVCDWDWVIPLNERLQRMTDNDELPPPSPLPDWSKNI